MSQDLKQARIIMSREWVMSTEQGREFLWEIITQCGIYHDIEGEGIHAFKQIGRRQVGLHLIGILTETSSELYFKMMKEAEARANQERLDAERKHADSRREEHARQFYSPSDELDSFIGRSTSQGPLPGYASGGPAI